MLKRLLLFTLAIIGPSLAAQQIQSPSEFLGYELGSQFTRHHRLVDYFEYVAGALPEQVQLSQYGTTNEGRRLMMAVLSTASNMERLEEIRAEHLQSMDGNGTSEIAMVWLSYNVHGNESVSSEASMETIYRLLTDKNKYLDNTVVIMDPCINPDGRDRYVNWYMQYKNTPFQMDPNSAEHREGWWTGRSNHYMFDLNRDWAWLTQVESRQRVAAYNQWMPHVHVDFHEQSMNSPYYFAPAAEPYHEVVTDFQREFQETVAKNHARYFDQNGWLYFTREVFDLFYPSYGDTYPTYNGAIGMTYEQGGGGRAGLGVIVDNGDTLTLKDRIAHHLTTGLSTVEVASAQAQRLNQEFNRFYGAAKNFEHKSYLMRGEADKIASLTALLDQHQIEYGFGTDRQVRGYHYAMGRSGTLPPSPETLVISTGQKKGTLVKVLFEPNAELSDSVTYDITAWSLPYAYGLETLASETDVRPLSGPGSRDGMTGGYGITGDASNAYAFLTDWNSMKDARFLADLLKSGVRVRRAERPFQTAENNVEWDRGTLIITRTDNDTLPNFTSTLSELARKHTKKLQAVSSGLVSQGKDFGSRYVGFIPEVKIAVLAEGPTSTLRFGEIWHYFEQQLGYPLTVLNASYLDRVDLDQYDVLLLPGGRGYRSFLSSDRKKELKDWVARGGRLIAMGGALRGLSGEDGFGIQTKDPENADAKDPLQKYDTSRRERIKESITGAIFKVHMDSTHPLAFGYPNTYYSLKLGSDSYAYLKQGTVGYLGATPKPVAGFAGSEALKLIPETLIFGVENHGRGRVVYMVDNPLFRGFWENGQLLLANALFMLD
jgi:hypothetical protein